MCLLWGGVHYCVQLLSWGEFFFFKHPLYVSFAKVFFLLSYFFFSLDHLKFWNFLSLEITIWSTIVCFFWGVHYCVQLLLEFCFQTIPFPGPLLLTFPIPFPLLKFFFLLINYFLSFFHLKLSEMPNFPKYIMPH